MARNAGNIYTICVVFQRFRCTYVYVIAHDTARNVREFPGYQCTIERRESLNLFVDDPT